jgi:hypothetical protein
MNENDYFFIITIAGIGIGLLHYITKTCYRTKCKDINLLWGCIHIERDIQQENNEDQFKINHNIRDSVATNNNLSV